MFVLDWQQERPSFEDSLRIWDSTVFRNKSENIECTPTELLNEIRKIYVNGDAKFACFDVAEDPRIDWFVSRNRLDEINFLDHLITSDALKGVVPELSPIQPLPSIEWKWTTPYTLDGEFADMLKRGGAYHEYEGSGQDAKQIGVKACEHLFGNRYDDLLLYSTHVRWSNWFYDVAWDTTWVGVDKCARTAWIICVTDTD